MMRAFTLLMVAVLISIPATGQTPAFEAASVKPNTSGDVRVRGGTRGRMYTAVNMPLRRIVSAAFEVQLEGFRLVGDQPLLSDRFDITATFSENATARDVPAMLRALLADRFKLVAHTETREAPIFALVLARRDGRTGPGLRQAALDCVAAETAGRVIPPPEPGQPATCESEINDRIKGRGQPLSALARMLTVFVQRRVVDHTGLSGGFDFDLQFEAAASGPTVDAATNVITALQEQLGLRLDSARAPVEFVVIDRIEPPTPD
jgi:uncharacterized protein (TIGR03435 family)